nr:Cof-type HAD-IIB family hydrolase [uncultured Blautia sp.]
MQYKFAAADMDGTLLNDANEITSYTVETIRRAVSQGLIFSICTGRPVQGVEQYLEQLGTQGPVITYNGAMILDSATGRVLYRQELDSEDGRRILEAGQKYHTTMCIWSDNKLYGNKLNDRIQEYSRAARVAPLPMPSIDELLAQGITKILWYDDVSKIQQIEKELHETAPFQNVTFCTSKPFYLEFFSSKVSKAAAIDRLGELYGFTQAETIAIGDGFNDLSMIRHAALGVAMANAPEGVKECADYITTRTNNEDGVAEVLEKFVL